MSKTYFKHKNGKSANFLVCHVESDGKGEYVGLDGKPLGYSGFDSHYALQMVQAGNWIIIPNETANEMISQAEQPSHTFKEIIDKNECGTYSRKSAPHQLIIIGKDYKNSHGPNLWVFNNSKNGIFESLCVYAWDEYEKFVKINGDIVKFSLTFKKL